MLTSFLVNVPVLSKQKVFTCAPSTVFWGSVPVIPRYPSLSKEKEYAKLKNIGRGGGAAEARKSINLKKTNNLSISSLSIRCMMTKKVMKLTMTTYSTKIRVVRIMSGSLTVLFKILRIIRPRWVVNPVLITTAYVLSAFVSKTLDPSKIQTFELLISDKS